MITVHKWEFILAPMLILNLLQGDLPETALVSHPTPANWLVTGGNLRPLNELYQLVPDSNKFAMALFPTKPDSPYHTLQIEMAVNLSNWQPNVSSVYMVIGLDSVGVLHLWASGYNGGQKRIVWGPIQAPLLNAQLHLFTQRSKAVTIVPLDHSLYFKWVITAQKSWVEINGVPLALPAVTLPGHITYVGLAVQGCTITFPVPQIARAP